MVEERERALRGTVAGKYRCGPSPFVFRKRELAHVPRVCRVFFPMHTIVPASVRLTRKIVPRESSEDEDRPRVISCADQRCRKFRRRSLSRIEIRPTLVFRRAIRTTAKPPCQEDRTFLFLSSSFSFFFAHPRAFPFPAVSSSLECSSSFLRSVSFFV